jgi:hypothetical protein
MWNLGKPQVFPVGSSSPRQPRAADTPFGSEPACLGGCGSQRATRPVNRPLVRVSGGKKYTITRAYKNNLRFLAGIWLSTEI